MLEKVTADIYIIENGVEVLLKSVETDQFGKIAGDLEPDKEYRIELRKDGFLNNDIFVNTTGMTGTQRISKFVGLTQNTTEQLIINNIEYDFNSPNLTENAKKELDNALIKVLQENPTIQIEIGSHTDSKGTAEYNKTLSQQRAESVVKYLTSKGIDPKRLKAKGYGESNPIAPNENADGSDNEAGRQKNRRTEFKIIGKIEPKKVEVTEED
jgi:outer membrane protein OmpA-like peptidoglycan-associated protein